MRQPPSRHGWDAAPHWLLNICSGVVCRWALGRGRATRAGDCRRAPFHAQFAADDNVATVPSVYQGAGRLQQKFASRGEAAKAADDAGTELIRQRRAARLVDEISPHVRRNKPRFGGNLVLIVITRTAGPKFFHGGPK